MEENDYGGEEDWGEESGEYAVARPKLGNNLPIWGNQRTMNINNLILTNIQASPYFKVKLYGLKTYHEVIDEIYYKIDNLEPWERGSRKTAGQTGMCGGVRGVGTGGIVSTSFCILYKLFTLKLTRKQLNGMLNHTDSPYIRGLGLMYIRFCQPPKDLFDWYEPYLDDPEEIDVKAGGGLILTIGQMARNLLTKLEWFDTLFPRIPVPIQKQIEEKLRTRMLAAKWAGRNNAPEEPVKEVTTQIRPSEERGTRDSSRSHSQRKDRSSKHRTRSRSRDRKHSRSKHSREREKIRDDDRKRSKRSRSRDRRSKDHDRKRRSRSTSRGSRKRKTRSRSRERERKKHRKEKKEKRSRSRDRHRERSHRSR